MKRSHVIAAVGLSTIAALSLSACSTSAGASSAGSGSAGSAITFLTFETPSLTAKFWDTSIKEAQAKVPGLKVKDIVAPGDRTAYAKQLQASGQLPDVLASVTTTDFTSAGLLQPFDQKWLNDNFLLPNSQSQKGKTYIPPTNAQTFVVYYNKALFEKAGITSTPKTYSELTDDVAKLKAAGITPMELAGGEAWAAAIPLETIVTTDVLGSDPKWVQERYKGTVKFTDSLFKDAAEKQAALIKAGAYGPAALSTDFATANKNFVGGKSGMYIMGSWLSGSGYIPADQADQFGAFALPTDDGKTVVPINVGGTTAVNAKSAHVADAMKFAKAWSLEPSSMKALIESDGAIPLMKKLKLSDYKASVSSLYDDTFKIATGSGDKVSAFGWVNNDDALAPGFGDKLAAMSQAMFSSNDLSGQLTQLDADWDAATK